MHRFLRLQAADKQGLALEEVDMNNMEAFLIQTGPYIDASYNEMVDESGSIDGYIREGLGQTEADISRLESELLE
jgi:protein tyrosine/serine phosphatase